MSNSVMINRLEIKDLDTNVSCKALRISDNYDDLFLDIQQLKDIISSSDLEYDCDSFEIPFDNIELFDFLYSIKEDSITLGGLIDYCVEHGCYIGPTFYDYEQFSHLL